MRLELLVELHLTATGYHLLTYGIIVQCYLSPDTSEYYTPRLNPSQTGRYLIYLSRRAVRLS